VQTTPDSNVRGLSTLGGRSWWIVGVIFALLVLAALSFVKFLGAAFSYSDWYGLPHMAAEIANAKRLADRFFLFSLVLTLLATGFMASFIGLEAISSGGFRMVARYISALAFCVFATGVFVWLLGILRVG
jgi:hypothetical protein